MHHPCHFVRKNCNGWEYGHIQVDNHALKDEKRTYVVVGKAPSYEEALERNAMALRGQPPSRLFDHNTMPPWRYN